MSFRPLASDEKDDQIKQCDVEKEQCDNDQRVQDLVSIDEIVEDLIGGAVVSHQEHIVQIQFAVGVPNGTVDDVCGGAKSTEDPKGNGHIFLFHTGHSGNAYIERRKTGYGMRDTRDDVGKGKNGICGIILAGTVGAKHRAQHTKDQNEIQSGIAESSLGKSGQRNGDELDTAQEQRKLADPDHGIAVSYTEKYDLEDLKAVNEDRRDDQNRIFLPICFAFLPEPYKNGKTNQYDHQRRNKGQVLPGQVSFGGKIAADAEKCFHFDATLLWYIARK